VIAVAAAIVVSMGAGMALEQRFGRLAHHLARLALTAMLFVLIPFVNFFVMARLHITAGVGVGVLLGYTELAIVGVVAWQVGRRLLGLSRPSVGALVCCASLANTSYLGNPLVGAVLGSGALGAAIAFDTVVSGPMFYVAGFAIGAAFGEQHAAARRRRGFLSAFVLRNPPLLAVVAGLLAPRALAPDALLHAAHVVVYALLPLGFLVLGVNLQAEAEGGALRFPPPLTRPVGAVIVLRLVLAPLLMLGLSALVLPVPKADLVQAAMPSGINSLVIAHAYGLDVRLTANAVAWTTALVVAAALLLTVL
jgi:predicted permease